MPHKSDAQRMAVLNTHLCALAVVLVLARELFALELVEHLADCLGRLRQHGFQRDAGRQLALFAKLVDSDIQ